MAGASLAESHGSFWTCVGILGGLIFYSRFYVQWFVSERRGRSVVPVSFWYMSGIGTLMLLPYAIVSQSPLGALSQCFNVVVYTRNLVHIWRGKGILTKRADVLIHVAVALTAALAVGFAITVWVREYSITRSPSSIAAHHTWIWLGIGLIGQALFTSRLLVQWIATERRRSSTVPPIFWHLSFFAAALQAASFVQRGEWVFAVGMAATLLVYARNIVLVHPQKAEGAVAS